MVPEPGPWQVAQAHVPDGGTDIKGMYIPEHCVGTGQALSAVLRCTVQLSAPPRPC